MIRLKNITKNDNIIRCDIFPEDSVLNGYLIYDITTNEIIYYSLPKGYEWCKKHVIHAKNCLKEMISSNKMQEEKLVMWI